MPSLMYFPVSLFEFLGKQKHNLIMPSSITHPFALLAFSPAVQRDIYLVGWVHST